MCRSPSPVRKRKASPSPAREAKGGSDRKRTRKPSDERAAASPETATAAATEDDAPVKDAAAEPAGAETCHIVVASHCVVRPAKGDMAEHNPRHECSGMEHRVRPPVSAMSLRTGLPIHE